MPSFGVYYPDDWPYIDDLTNGAKSRDLKVATYSRLLIEQSLKGEQRKAEQPSPLDDSVVVDLAAVLLSPRMAGEMADLLGDADQVAEMRAMLHGRLVELREQGGGKHPLAAEDPAPYRPTKVRRNVDQAVSDQQKQA